MDYPGDQTQDMNDIGLYDKAAMRFGYADLVDVEKNMKYSALAGRAAPPAERALDYVSAARRLRRHLRLVGRRQSLQHVQRQVRPPRHVLARGRGGRAIPAIRWRSSAPGPTSTTSPSVT